MASQLGRFRKMEEEEEERSLGRECSPDFDANISKP
jgi:hypothetical protein